MSRASSFLGVFPLPFASASRFPAAVGLSPGGGGRLAPAPVPATTSLVRLPQFSSSEQTQMSRQSRMRPSRQPRGRAGLCPGCDERGCARGYHTCPACNLLGDHLPTHQAIAALARWEPNGAPNPRVLSGEGSWRARQDVESPGRSSRGSGRSPPSPPLPCPAPPSGIYCRGRTVRWPKRQR